MSDLPYMPFFVSDYALEAGHLTDEEHGAYLRLRILAWSSPGCRLPNDDEWLARRLARPIETVRTLYRRVLDELWECDGNWLSRTDLKLAYERGKANSSARSLSAKARWNKEKGACKSNASKLKLNTKNLEPQTPETPAPNAVEPELPLAPSAPAVPASKPKAQKPAYPPQFEQLWQAYPLRKQDRDAKVDVFNRWKTETKGQDHEAIIAAARAFARANGQDDYRIGLKSWLRNRAWLSGPVLVTNGQPVRASPLTGAEFNRAERAHREKVEDQVEAKGHARWSPEWEQEVAVLMMEWVNEQRRSA